jgi:hypothetical protein
MKAYSMLEVYTYREHLVDAMTVTGDVVTFTVKAHQRNLGENIVKTMQSLFQYEMEMPQVIAIN